MLSDVITVNDEKCVGCNQCISVCPQKETNIAFFDGKNMKVKLDQTKCIHCGACLEVCSHGARQYSDDSAEILKLIKSGKKYSVAAAPSIQVNFKSNWENILSTFRDYGASGVYDVSLGADICTWAHVRYLQKHGTRKMISQPCPAVVNYITKYRSDLIDLLSPVHSPMLCLSVFLKKYLHNDDRVIYLSPCIGKSDEFRQTGVSAYNLTFANLQKLIEAGEIRLSMKKSGFDLFEAGMGSIFSRPGGLKQNLEFYLGGSLTVHKVEGMQKIYDYFNEINESTKRFLPDLIDVLNCENGCNFGTGCSNKNCILEAEMIMDERKKRSEKHYPKTDGQANEIFEWFDQNLNPDDFLRTYSAEDCGKSYETLMTQEEAFGLLEKHTFEERNFNCGACGSHSCSEMADKIAKGLNIPKNCVWKVKKELAQESKKVGEFSDSLTKEVFRMTEELKQTVSELSSRNEDLVSALKTIGKIASTTQLLSFNTSIEAKRAGTAGAAFSVIASEVKRLSEDSSEAEKGMEQMVKDNDKMTKNAVTQLDNIKEMLDQISQVVKKLAVSE